MKRAAVKRIPLELLNDVYSKLDEVSNMLMPYLISLNTAERESLVETGAESFGFLKLSFKYAVQFPEFIEPFTDMRAFRNNFSIAEKLVALAKRLRLLTENINDTELSAAGTAMDTAFLFYDAIRIAARRDIPCGKALYEELKPWAPRKKTRGKISGNHKKRIDNER